MDVHLQNLEPSPTSTVSIVGGAASASVAFNLTAAGLGARTRKRDVYLVNSGTAIGFVELGVAGVVATVPNGSTPGSMPIGPGGGLVLSASSATHVAFIVPTGTATLFITPGEGS